MAQKPDTEGFLASSARLASSRKTLLLTALAALVLAGCGGGSEDGQTASRAKSSGADIALSGPAFSPAAEGVATLPAAYTCDGSDSWPALQWRGVPAGTKELLLFAMKSEPVKGKPFFDWAAADIDPQAQGISAGKLPPSAVVGHNSYSQVGYSICPPKGQGETYIFALYALPKRISPQTGFDPAKLRQEALALSSKMGLLTVSYSR